MNINKGVFITLLVIAFVSQAMIDVLGFTGFYYGMYDPEVFSYSGHGSRVTGHGSLVSFELIFGLYALWAVVYYVSVISMALFHWTAWVFIPLALALSLAQQPLSGIYVGTPFELTVSWVGWAAYYICIGMWFCSISENSYRSRKLAKERSERS